MQFEFDEKKAAANLKKHGVSFSEVVEAFEDGIELFDASNSSSEIRYQIIAHSKTKLLFVAFTVINKDVVRLISARRGKKSEVKIYHEQNS